MAILSLTVVPCKALKDGRHKVRIAVAHRSQTRYILTDVIINSTKEWKNGKIVKRDDATYLNTKLLQRMQEVQRIIDETPYTEGMTCAELVATILHTRGKKTHTLRSAFEEMLEVSTAKDTTKERYRTRFKSITSVIPETTFMSHLTPLMVQRFMKKRGAEIAPITLQTQVTLLSQIVKFCQMNGYTDFRIPPTQGCYHRVVAVRQNWLTPDQVRFIRDNKHTLAALRTAKMAAAAQVVAQAAREKLFCFPFFVRYAYRLFDGSNTMQSPPILMLPTTSVAPSLDMGKDFMVKGSRLHGPAEITAAVNAFALYHIAAHSAALDQLAKWKDVVQGIDIFISRQFFTYNQGAPDDQIKPFTATLPEADYASALAENGLFYFLKNIPLDEIYTSASAASASSSSSPSAADASGGRHPSGYGTNLRGCIKPDFDLTNDVIVTRRTLDDDYDSHDTLVPRLFYAFNARANIAAISKRLFRGFPPQCFFFQSDFTGKVHHSGGATGTASATSWHSKGTPVNTSCLVVVETDGREIALPSPSAQVYLDDDRRILWFYYPNPKARRVYFKTGDTVQCLPLTTHSMLNGAFYLNLDKKVVTAPAMPQATPCQESQVEMPGKIYTSEAGNPFYFPVTGINTVGTGTILGLCSAVKALSQGQFGQFPLYAFTTEGVWALELSSTGTYRAIQPVTRDVCINALSITQIDDAVLFATQRGIMLIQGSQAQCITDTVFSQAPFNVLDLPAMSQLHAKLGHMTHDHGLLVKPFLNFLSACRMVYDYVHQHIIVFNPTLGDDRQPLYSYAYVFSLRSKQWGMILSHLVSPVGAYPDAMAMTLEGSLVSFSHMGDTASKGLYITRPLKLDAPNVHKTVSALIQRGHFQRGDVSTVLYGSRDLYTWRLVSSSRDHYLRGFRGTPYKYFRIAALASLSVGKSIFGASVQFDPRHTNNLR